jgi:NTP pyrophosphatase (non-canonical NTP hydrolase)
MDSKTYLKESGRTASGDYLAIGARTVGGILAIGSVVEGDKIDLLHAAIGMQTESAEFSDMLKKHLFYGKPLDVVNLTEELGDQMWYIAMALRALGTDFETVMERNISKLRVRYPDKFTEDLAENRDLCKERGILEGKGNL